MSFLKNLFGHKETAAPAVAEPVACSHVSLLARWDSVEDMGKEDKAAYFICESCGERFSSEDGRKRQGATGIDQFRRPTS